MDARQAHILGLLAAYVDLKPSQLITRLELRRDLQLEPLDVVLFALDLETGRELPFPFEALDGARTVADLLDVVSSWLEAEAREARSARKQSEIPAVPRGEPRHLHLLS